MNPIAMMQLKPLLEGFRDRHPKFLQFFAYAGQKATAGSLVEISLTGEDGQKIITNIRISPEDVELFRQIKDLL